MRKFVNLFYEVRKDEWSSAGLMFLLHFLLMGTLYFLKPARDSLFLSEIGPRQLPFVYLLLAAVAIPVTIYMTKNLRQHTSRKVLQNSMLFFIGTLAVLRWVFTLDVQWIFVAFYIWVGIFGILVISQFWLYANALFNAAQSKRLFSFLNLGAILGAIAGSQASSILVAWIDLSTENLLFVSMGLLAVSYALIFCIDDEEEDEEQESIDVEEEASFAYSTRDVFKTVFKSRYQLLIAGIIGFAMLVSTLVDYQFKTVASEAYTSTTGLTSFLGTFYGTLSFVSLLIQILLSAQIIKRLGLGGAILSRPISILIGSVLFLFEPVLAVAIYMQGFDRATRYSIDKTGRELLFLPLPQSVKRKTKIFMDIFVDRFFRGIAGLLLMGSIFIRDFTVEQISYLVIASIAVWIALSFWARREYVLKFRDSLRKRYIDVDKISLNLNEPMVYRVVKEMLESDNTSRVIYALVMLRDSQVEKVAPQLESLLSSEHRKVRLRALQLLQKTKVINASDKVEKMLSDDDPEIRLEAVNYLCEHSEESPAEVMQAYLEHEDEALKYAALSCVHKHGNAEDISIDDELIEEVLQRDDKNAIVIQAQIAQVLGYKPDHPKSEQFLSTLLARNEPMIVRRTLESMQQLKNEKFLPKLLNKLQEPEYVGDIQQTLAAYGADCFDMYIEVFRDPSKDIEIREEIPGIFVKVARQTTVDTLQGMLDVPNPRLRYKVIKALNKLRKNNRRLEFDEEKIREILRMESKAYFELLAVKAVQRTDIPNNILIISLKEKMDQTKERLFRLAGLLHDQQDIYGSYLALRSNSEDTRAASVEFIDNVLEAEGRKYIMPIIDTPDEDEKMEKGRDLFEMDINDYESGMMKLLEGEDIWLRACALFSISNSCPDSLQNKLEAATENEEPELIRETAEYVLKRNKKA